MDIFLERVPPQEEPQGGLSGGIPEEDVVVIEMTALFMILPLKTFQWDKMWR